MSSRQPHHAQACVRAAAHAGLLETRHGVGTRVRDVLRLGGADLLPMLVGHSPDWIGELFEVRRSIGALIAERAAARATPAQVTELRALMTAVRAAQGGEAAQLADAEVHRALARATGNRVYVLLTNTLFNAYLPVRAALVGPFAEAEAAHARLAPVVDAVAAGDRAAVHATADAYLSATERIMLDDLARARDAEAAGELESAVRVGRDDGAAARRAMGRLLFAAGAEEVLTGVAHAEPRCGARGPPQPSSCAPARAAAHWRRVRPVAAGTAVRALLAEHRIEQPYEQLPTAS
ncbi:FadR/GntR family transcriptional regulator [Streptomyces sp. NPDC002778]